MNRASEEVRTERLMPSTKDERGVYHEAGITPAGAWILPVLSRADRRLEIHTSRQAAALEELARVIRIQLQNQETASISRERGIGRILSDGYTPTTEVKS